MKDIYILSNLINNTTDINSPLKNTQRVKYTCFDISKRYIVFGASSGSLYIFQRKPCKFLQLIPNKYRTITNLSISPNERFIAFTTQKGIISVLVINISSTSSASSSPSSSSTSKFTSAVTTGTSTINSIPQLVTTKINNGSSNSGGGDDDYNGDDITNRIVSTSQSTITSSSQSFSSSSSSSSSAAAALMTTTAAQITGSSNNSCLYWSSDEKQFYYGNHKGEVYLITLTLFVGKTLIDITVHPILFLDSPIIQISEYESLLLVSNYTKCILCNMDYEEYKQIGNQPRDGIYGGCFSILDKNNYQTARIYCTRPGYRIWEINLEGNVLKTHEYKLAIGCQPTKIFNNNNDDDNIDGNDRNDLYKNDKENHDEKYNNKEVIDDSNDDDDDDEDNDVNDINKDIHQQQNNLQFTKLYTINNDKFILTYNHYGIYIIDPRDQSLILWTNKFKNIQYCNIINNEIYIFTTYGQLYSIQLETLQTFIINLIKNKNNMNLCIKLLRKNLKYFSEKTKEDYNLLILDNIKKYLIDNNQYDILNDLSVIFDCVQNIKHNPNILLNNIYKAKHNLNNKQMIKDTKHIGNNDNDDDDRNSMNSNNSSNSTNSSNNSSNSSSSSSGVYILENSFCDNLKNNKHISTTSSSSTSSIFKSSKFSTSTTDKHLKDMLLTVTGKFGKNIIKYKFNIFNDEEKSLVVEDLLPNIKTKNINNDITKNNDSMINRNQKNLSSSIQEIYKNEKHEIYENHINDKNDGDDDEDDQICDHVIVKKNSLKLLEEKVITEEEKTVYDLYLIWKTSKISNLCFLDRYRKIFDRYTSKDIIKLLNKLEMVMIENDSNDIDIDDDDDNDKNDDNNDINDCNEKISSNHYIDSNTNKKIDQNHDHYHHNQQHHKNLRHNNRLLKTKINCYEIYFNYLKPELIWELDDITRDYIKNGFILLNTINNYDNNKKNIINCFKCNYPLIFSLDCKYRNIGEELYKFYKSRNELLKCLDFIKNVPSLMNILCKYYLIKYHENIDTDKINNKNDNSNDNDDNDDGDDNYNNDLCKKLIKIPLNYGDIKLFTDISKYYDHKLWNYCFELFSNIQNYKLFCIECNECNIIDSYFITNNEFYKWNTFLDIALNYLDSDIFLGFLLKYSNLMPNDCIKKDIFIRCLLK